MSALAAHQVATLLKGLPTPTEGGPSRAYRAVLTALARDALVKREHTSYVSATAIAHEFGYSERHVRRMFDAIEAAGHARRERRPGKSDSWRFPVSGYPQPRSSDVRGSTPLDHPQPRTPDAHTPDIPSPHPGHQMSDDGFMVSLHDGRACACGGALIPGRWRCQGCQDQVDLAELKVAAMLRLRA